jgi:transcriptional regulator with XRE-family HTH domain
MGLEVLFRRRLRQLIKGKYRSLDRFYLETGFSKGHLSEILRGKGSPSVTTVIRLARLLELEPRDLFVFPDSAGDEKVRSATQRRNHQVKLLDEEIRRIEDINRQGLRELKLPADPDGLLEALRDGDPADAGSSRYRRAGSIWYTLYIALPKVVKHAHAGQAILAATWALRAGSGGDVGRLAERAARSVLALRTGPAAPKHSAAIQHVVDAMLQEKPKLSLGALWLRFPGSANPARFTDEAGSVFVVYRDDDKIVAANPRTMTERSIRRRTLEGYLRRAKKLPQHGQ